MSGSETGSEDVGPRGGSGGAGGAGNGGGDLASRTLVLESKRFYLDKHTFSLVICIYFTVQVGKL